MDDKIVEFPARELPAEAAEVAEMRASLLAVRDEPHAMAPRKLVQSPRKLVQSRIVFLAERIADILDQVEISDADRQSLLWHLSLIRELAADRKGGITP